MNLTKKKDFKKINISSSHKIEICHIFALKNGFSKKKKMAAKIKNKKKLSLSMDTKKKDNKRLFSTLKHRSTPSKLQVELLG